MNVSPSQLATALECDRKRWFQSHIRMPDTKDPAKRDIGTILHNAAERWLNADDQGVDPKTGSPANPFPDQWDVVHDRGRVNRISPRDAATVRKLVRDGIDSGVLRRLPNRQVEVEFQRQISPNALMRGRIDQRNPGIIEDHKTTGQKKYALDAAQLAEDPKMLCYAAEHFFVYPELQSLVMRLNYFLKDPTAFPNTFAVETTVNRADVERFWTEVVVPEAALMLQWEEAAPTIDKWRLVPGPRKEGACTAYGGCPYQRICTGMDRKEDQPMGVFDKLKSIKTQPAPTPTQATTATAEAPAETTQASPAPPWRQPGCKACNGTGVSSKGRPCGACDVVSSRLGGPMSSQYKTWVDDTGFFRWSETPGVDLMKAAGVNIVTNSTPSTSEPTTAQFKTWIDEAPPATDPPKKKRGRPSKADVAARQLATQTEAPVEPAPVETAPLPPATVSAILRQEDLDLSKLPDKWAAVRTLFIDCLPEGVDFERAEEVLAREGAEIARVMGAPSYFLVDAFKRRDMLCAAAKQIVDSLQAPALVVTGANTDINAMVSAMRPFFDIVVTGVK